MRHTVLSSALHQIDHLRAACQDPEPRDSPEQQHAESQARAAQAQGSAVKHECRASSLTAPCLLLYDRFEWQMSSDILLNYIRAGFGSGAGRPVQQPENDMSGSSVIASGGEKFAGCMFRAQRLGRTAGPAA